MWSCYRHCYRHPLNLAVNDCIRKLEVLKDAWVMKKEVCNLVKKPPSREGAITKVEKSVGWTFDVNFCYCKGAAKC